MITIFLLLLIFPLLASSTSKIPDKNSKKELEQKVTLHEEALPEIVKLLEEKITELNKVFIFTDSKEHEKALSALSYEIGGGICCADYENPYEWYGHSPLTRAAATKDLKKVMKLVNSGVEINKKNYWGKTAFIEAANAGSLEIVEYLKEQGALINLDELGKALYNAASSSNTDLLKFLLAAGVSPNKVATKYLSCVLSIRSPVHTDHLMGEPALFGAARNGCLECIDLLFEAGADITMKNNDGWSILECLFDVYKVDDQRRSKFYNSSTGYGPTQLIQSLSYLIDKGARVDDAAFEEILKVAAEWVDLPDHYEEEIKSARQLLKLLETKKDVLTQKTDKLQERSKELPELHKALNLNNIKKARRILKRRPMAIYERDEDNNTALMCALKTKNPTLIALILKQVTDGNASNDRNQTALTIALNTGEREILKMVLDSQKIEVNAVCDGMPVLEKVLRSELPEDKKLELTRLLLDAGADPNALLGEGETVLALAVRAENVPLTKLLLAKGAFTNIQSGGGVTPLAHAVWNSNVEIARLLLEDGASPHCEGYRDPLFCDVLEYNNTEMIQLFLERGADIHTPCCFATPLHFTAEKGNLKAVELLLDHGATFGPATYKTEDGEEYKLDNFPLCQAIKEGHTDVIKLLLEKGADWAEKDDTRKTAQEYALENDNQDILKYLDVYKPRSSIES